MRTQSQVKLAPRYTAAHVVPAIPKQGMTMLSFLGRGSNSRPFYGQSGQRYLFGGKHHMTGYVFDSDVNSLLAMKESGRPLFQVVKPPAPVKKKFTAPAVVVSIAPEPEIKTAAKPRKSRAKKVE